MGLFSTVLHLYKKTQPEVIAALQEELKHHRFTSFERIVIDSSDWEKTLEDIHSQTGNFYLVTQPHGTWITIIEIQVNIDPRHYLYEMTEGMSEELNTYALSFHLHHGDVLLYDLDRNGDFLDGYNSNYQYFLPDPAGKEEIISQKHNPAPFTDILPPHKTASELNLLLNEGYWDAFDNNDLDTDGIPNHEKYDVDEEERFITIGKYLEIYSPDDYPFANWYENITKLNPADCYLLKAIR